MARAPAFLDTTVGHSQKTGGSSLNKNRIAYELESGTVVETTLSHCGPIQRVGLDLHAQHHIHLTQDMVVDRMAVNIPMVAIKHTMSQ